MQRKTLRRGLIGLAAAGLLAGVLGASTASANLPGSTFEGNDANVVVNTPGNTDWVNAPALHIGTDLASGQTDNSFGNGTQEKDLNVTVGLGSIPNSKADLGKFGVSSEVISTAGPQHGHTMMYLAWTRNNQSGSTNFDFEINKAAQPNLTTPGPKTLVRTTGDLLINYGIQGGAQNPTLTLRTWGANGLWSGETDLTAAGVADGAINTNVAIPGGPFGGTIAASQFGEAEIDMTAAGVIPDQDDPNAPCTGFGSAYVKSRASQSFTSEIKDFIAPVGIDLNSCGTLIIKKVTVPNPDPTNTSFSFALGGNSLSKTFALKNGEQNTTADLKAGSGYTAAETVPTGWTLTSATCDNGSPVTNISVAVGVTTTCTFTNTGQANLHVVKVAERDGVTFNFTSGTLTPASFSLVGNGADQDFTNINPGTYDVAETVPANWNLDSAVCSDNSPVTAIVLSPGEDTTCTFTDKIERGAVAVHKTAKHKAAEGGIAPVAGVTFTVTNATNGTNTTMVTDASGNACVAGLPVSGLDGNYNIHETVPAGYQGGVADQVVAVVEGDCTSAASTPANFVNTPLTNITVSVDSQIPGGTNSTIDCTVASGSTDPATGDGSVTAPDLAPGTYTCVVVIDP